MLGRRHKNYIQSKSSGLSPDVPDSQYRRPVNVFSKESGCGMRIVTNTVLNIYLQWQLECWEVFLSSSPSFRSKGETHIDTNWQFRPDSQYRRTTHSSWNFEPHPLQPWLEKKKLFQTQNQGLFFRMSILTGPLYCRLYVHRGPARHWWNVMVVTNTIPFLHRAKPPKLWICPIILVNFVVKRQIYIFCSHSFQGFFTWWPWRESGPRPPLPCWKKKVPISIKEIARKRKKRTSCPD